MSKKASRNEPSEADAQVRPEDPDDRAQNDQTETQRAAEADQPSPEQRIRELEDQLLRARADYQNLKRRIMAEKSEAIRFANADLMRSLLSVIDDLERSIDAGTGAQDAGPVVEGVRLVRANLLKALSAAGLEPIEAVGRPFDPHVHEAMMQAPSAEHDPGTVVEELLKGYTLRDRVLRPARVIVAKPADGSGPSAVPSPDSSDSRSE